LEGARDLQTAAALEPNRSLLRSYLGTHSNSRDETNATRELTLAKATRCERRRRGFIPRNSAPATSYNEAVEDLEQSVALTRTGACIAPAFCWIRIRRVRKARVSGDPLIASAG